MTQTGHYATIVKQKLHGYWIVHDNAFTVEGGVADASQMDTRLFVEIDESVEAIHKLLI